jgi:hypothetical protein
MKKVGKRKGRGRDPFCACKQMKHRNPESGYALLFIYAMAAVVAIMLYNQLPRVAFEAQRDKEQLLVYRGEQYSRGVQLYVRKFNKFPADFDALQNTQNQRFLRRKYKDPMTGKDDWRLIHVGPGGVFTDSLIYGKKKDDKQAAEQQNFITEMQQTGGNQIDANQNVNVGTRQRQSDQPGAPGDLNNATQPPQLDSNGQPIPNAPAPVQVLPNGQIVPVQQGNQSALPGQFQTGQPPPGFPGGLPGQPFPGGFPGQQGGAPGQPPNPAVNGPPGAAAALIGQILTTPRPGGLNGLGGIQQGAVDPNAANAQAGTTSTIGAGTATATTQTGTAAQTIGGGIAGVASKLEEDGIKIYKEQKSYHKWEFVYDITKDPARTGGAVPQGAPPPGTPIGGAAAPIGTSPMNGNGTPAPNGIPVPNATTLPTPAVPSQ